MSSRKRKMEELRALCAQVHEDDGVDPRDDKRRGARTNEKPDRKTRQLCKQVTQILQLALGAIPGAELLVGVTVQDVAPAPNAGRLRVVMAAPAGASPEAIAAILERFSGRLRTEVATSITRKRAPELTFAVVVEGGGDG